MIKFFDVIYLKHKSFWSQDKFLGLSIAISIFLLALTVQYVTHKYVGSYVSGTRVGDFLLDNIPAINVDFFIIQGTLLLTLVLILLLVANPKHLLFSLKSLGLFIIIRSFFVSLTHLGANLNQISFDANTIGFKIYDLLYTTQNDFFFSGHVGIPFLFALIFWKATFWRYLFFITSFLLGVGMILGHLHYSIDVFAAPFITYSIFAISRNVFKKDFALIQ